MAGPAVLTVADTIAKSFLLAVETRGDRPAIREKKFGIWQPTSWRQWLQISKEIAYAPARHRLPARRRRLDHRQRRAGMGVCRYGHPVRRRRLLRHLSDRFRRRRSNISINDSAHQGDLRRRRGAARQDPVVPRALPDAAEDRRLRHGRPERLQRSDGACRSPSSWRSGSNHMQGREALWEEMIASRGADDLAILVYTSGTTGPPKGAMHSNRSVTHQMRHANDLFPVHRRRRAAGVPAALPCRRAGRRLLHLAGAGIGDEFRRKPGDGAG